MITTKLDIQCIWGGTLVGFLAKHEKQTTATFGQTVRIIGIHGWLDNLNSLLPLAERLIDRHPNYEICLYDRAGHGFSSHLPKGFDYSGVQNTQDLRSIIQSLGWNRSKFSIIGHSYGGILATIYAASYPDEVFCIITIDALPRSETTAEALFKDHGARIDASLAFHSKPARTFDAELTFEKALELAKSSRTGISDEAARLLTERSVRLDESNKLHFTRDEALKLASVQTFTEDAVRIIIRSLKAPVLFIGARESQWSRSQCSIDLFKQYHPDFEMAFIDGPHHLHMTHVEEVAERIEHHFKKYLHQPSASLKEKSKL